ncbi:MAG: hypothetical protein LCH77_01080 [Actinobacteria bacterium]|nr:hypothetical protein [Actinomycetota bacterium]
MTSIDGRTWFGLNGTGEVRTGAGAKVAVGSHPLRLTAAADGGAWVSVFGDSELVRLSATGAVLRRVPLSGGGRPEGVVGSVSDLWVVDERADDLVRLDPDTGAERQRTRVGSGPRLLTLGASKVWVTAYDDGTVTAVDRTSGAAGPSRKGVCRGPQGVVVARGLVWVACTVEHVVVALEPTGLAEVASLQLRDADAVAATGDHVFAVGQSGPVVLTIDASTHAVVRRSTLGMHQAVGDGNVDAAIVGADLVVTHPEAKRIWRIPLSSLRP